jgi:hypothetical protein
MKLDNYGMKDGKIDHRIADIQNDAIPEIGEHIFPWLELATRNQNGCSSPDGKNWNLNRTPGWRNLCSFARMENYRIVPRMDNY